MNPTTSRRTDADPSFLPPKPSLKGPWTRSWGVGSSHQEIRSNGPLPVRDFGVKSIKDIHKPGIPYAGHEWEEPMRRRFPGGLGPCRHFMDGHAGSPAACNRSYDCDGCLVDYNFDYRPTAALIESYRRLGRRNKDENEPTR
jgi:hypothetical protein